MEGWTRRMIRYRWAVVAVWAVVFVASAIAMSGLADLLTNRFTLPGTDTARAEKILHDHFGQRSDGSFTIVVKGAPGSAETLLPPGADARRSEPPRCSPRPRSPAFSPSRTPSSARGSSRGFSRPTRRATRTTCAPRSGTIPGAQVYVSGQAAIEHDLDPVFAHDLTVGELFIAIPIALLILVFVFGTLAFLIPFVFAAAAIPTTLGIIWIFANFVELTTYLQNLVMLIGLGIAIDYSLLVVYRYREELANADSKEDAVVRTMATAGRAVVFSGTAVAIGLALMLFMPLPFMRGFGIGGLVIPLVSVVCAVTLLPVLALLPRREARPRAAHPQARCRAARGSGVELLDQALAPDHAPPRALRRRHRDLPRDPRPPGADDGGGAGLEQGDPAGPRGRPGPQHHLRRGRRGRARPDADRDRHRPGRRRRTIPASRRRSDGSSRG